MLNMYTSTDRTQAPHRRNMHPSEFISTAGQSHMKTYLVAHKSQQHPNEEALPICNLLLVLGRIQSWKGLCAFSAWKDSVMERIGRHIYNSDRQMDNIQT
jgi:hypothetical protein